MTGQCSICLSDFTDPVCIPCGHVYCRKCITDVANRPENVATVAKCPTCRTDFHLVVPDLTYLPKKYHPFVVRSVRRIFIDESPDAVSRRSLQKDVSHLTTRVVALEKNEERLMRECERHQAKSRAYRERERDARLEKNKWEEQCQALTEEVEGLKEEVAGMESLVEEERVENSALHNKVSELVKGNQELLKKLEVVEARQERSQLQIRQQKQKQKQVPVPRPRQRGPARTVEREDSEEEEEEEEMTERITRPLPRRTRKYVSLGGIEETSASVKVPEHKKQRLSEGSGTRPKRQPRLALEDVVGVNGGIERRSKRLLRSSASVASIDIFC